MQIRFPWPNPKLSSNSRLAHRYATNERQQAREIGYWLIKDARVSFEKDDVLEMKIIICPPDRRRRDWDNIVTAFKSTQDGIFKALEMDDRSIKRTIIEWGEIEHGGALYVSFDVLL